jgi:hypothetical protein
MLLSRPRLLCLTQSHVTLDPWSKQSQWDRPISLLSTTTQWSWSWSWSRAEPWRTQPELKALSWRLSPSSKPGSSSESYSSFLCGRCSSRCRLLTSHSLSTLWYVFSSLPRRCQLIPRQLSLQYPRSAETTTTDEGYLGRHSLPSK